MKIEQTLFRYNNVQSPKYRYQFRNNIDTVNFRGINAQKVMSLVEFSDNIVMSDHEKIAQMIDLAQNARLRKIELVTKEASKNVVKKGISKLKNVFSKDDTKHNSEVLRTYYDELGKANFIRRNFDFFKRLIDNTEEINLKGCNDFNAEVSKLLSPQRTKSFEGYSLSKTLGSDSAHMFDAAGNQNGAILFINRHSIFLSEMRKTLKAKSVTSVSEKSSDVIQAAIPKTEIPSSSSIKTITTEPPKFDGQKTLSEYKELLNKQKDWPECVTEEEKTLWRTQDEKRMELRSVLKENNVSLVEKAEFSLDPTKDVEAKRAYFLSNKVGNASFNEASTLDYLDMFDKYGDRYWVDEKCGMHSLIKLSSKIGEEPSDKVLSKYIDIMDKLAQRDNAGMRDASSVMVILDYNAKNMSKETFLKFIKVFKKVSFQQGDAYMAETYLMRTKFKDDKDVANALSDLRTSLKDFPEVDKTKND